MKDKFTKSIFIIVALFLCFNSKAQTPASEIKSPVKAQTPAAKTGSKKKAEIPAANLIGPRKALANGENIVLTSEILTDEEPVTSYVLWNNTSGATIVSKGAFQPNKETGIGKQTVTIKPGSEKGSFTIRLMVTTSGGTCESSRSITVFDAPVPDNVPNKNVH